MNYLLEKLYHLGCKAIYLHHQTW